MFYRSLIQHSLQKEDVKNLEKECIIDEEHKSITHRGIPLAGGFKNSQELISCKANILKSLETLKKSNEAQQVFNTFEQVGKILPKVKTELRAVRLMGVVPARCRICRQLGL